MSRRMGRNCHVQGDLETKAAVDFMFNALLTLNAPIKEKERSHIPSEKECLAAYKGAYVAGCVSEGWRRDNRSQINPR